MSQELKSRPKKTSFAIPYTQFVWGDYYADTDYLTFEEHGIYWNLLRRYYTTGPFPQDLGDLKRKMRCINEKDAKLLEVLNEFFYISDEDNCWHQKRCDEEIARVKGISEIQSQRARKAIQSRKRQANGQFTTNNSPEAAGQLPAIKDIRGKSEYENSIERQRVIEDEEQELTKILRNKYEEMYKDVRNKELKEKAITIKIEKDIEEWKFNRLREML